MARRLLVSTAVGLACGYGFGLLAKPEYIWHVRLLASVWMGFCVFFPLYIVRQR